MSIELKIKREREMMLRLGKQAEFGETSSVQVRG